MSCDKYADCTYCTKKEDCPYDLMGDGSAWCGGFECCIDNCKRSICITEEDMMFD